jgi:hypothetical protein
MGLRTGRARGRPRGARNRRTKEIIQLGQAAAAAIENAIPDAFIGDAHTLLMTIYKNPTFDMAVRLDAAKAAAPYEKPKLASTEFKGDPDKPVQHKFTIEFVRAGEK